MYDSLVLSLLSSYTPTERTTTRASMLLVLQLPWSYAPASPTNQYHAPHCTCHENALAGGGRSAVETSLYIRPCACIHITAHCTRIPNIETLPAI